MSKPLSALLDHIEDMAEELRRFVYDERKGRLTWRDRDSLRDRCDEFILVVNEYIERRLTE